MANESIVTGKKYRILVDAAQKLWQRVSFWTKSTDVEFNDGKTAETKVGSINGITSSLTSSDGNIALSAAAGRTLNSNLTNNINALNTQLATINVYVGSDGKLHFVNRAGADTALPFSTTFTKIQGMLGTFNSGAHTNTFSTGVTGKTLWKTIFIVPMIIPASGSSSNNFYNGGSITYDTNTGVIVINASYRQVTADIYYVA